MAPKNVPKASGAERIERFDRFASPLSNQCQHIDSTKLGVTRL